MKKTAVLFILVLSIMFVACNNSNNTSEKNKAKTTTSITQADIAGEWKCIDITNGVSHMKSIAEMQPHIVFNEKNTISAKIKSSDGSFLKQKMGTYKIENGTIVSSLYEVNPYMENNQLVIEDPSADNKRLYEKVK